MPTASNPQHPLVRDGRSQVERLDLRMLAPESVALDDRSERQLLVYLNEFAKAVVFHQTAATPEKQLQESNWQPFFRSSSSVHTSLIEAFDIASYETRYNNTRQRFAEGLNRADYALWFDFLFDSALTVNNWFLALSNDIILLENKVILNETPLRRIIQGLIQSNLQPALAQLFGLANLFVRSTDSATGYQIPDLSILAEQTSRELWNLDVIQYSRDTTLAGLEHRPTERTKRITERLEDIFRTFSKTIRQIVADAAQQDILQATGTHEPHLALLYTFLRLLRPVTQDFNGLTQKHLDFYYSDVLGLKAKPLEPDALHVLFELPKPVSSYRVPQATLLKDGKDAHNIDVHFALNEEIIVSRTKIAELRTLFRNADYFLAKPKAHSLDGLGKDFADPADIKWATLGNDEGHNQQETNATIGLAIASETLLLSSGVRTVTLTLSLAPEISLPWQIDATSEEVKCPVEVRLSGQKKWFSPKNMATAKLLGGVPNNGRPGELKGDQLVVTFSLEIKEEAVVAADPVVLGVNYGLTNEAVVQLLLKKEPKLYEAMRQVQLMRVKITTNVSQLQNVLVRTEEGDQDPTKPFMPFGAIPSAGSAFAIGSPEIFSKELETFTVSFEWDKKPQAFSQYYEGYSLINPAIVPSGEEAFSREVYFYKNSLLKKKTDSGNVFAPLGLQSGDFNLHTGIEENLSSVAAVSALKDPGWQQGAIVIKLGRDFLHQYYGEALTRRALALANPTSPPIEVSGVTPTAIEAVKAGITNLPITPFDPTATIPQQTVLADNLKGAANLRVDTLKHLSVAPLTINPPYTPVIKNLTISYTANAKEAALFHILPFDGGANYLPVGTGDAPSSSLLYNFSKQGALLIGLADAVEGSLTPLLFQLLESSAKTHLPEAKISWEYLDGNDWQELTAGKYLVHDATKGFIQPGIVQVVLPERKSTQQTTRLPPQYFWLKAATADDPDALCKAIGVHTQAALASFAPVLAADPAKQNDAARLAVPLTAGSVTKLAVADANIKAIQQPYGSFGGRPLESETHFYSRVSEQLRHKGRGVTLFDYEQMILEAFPEVFKVKCIPHTYANRSIGVAGTFINDVHAAPGHVTLVVVPDVTRTQLDDLEKPMASRGLLTRIEDWMKTRISPFAKLRVLNPIYEKVDTDFWVQFHPGKSPEFYAEQLKKEIGLFLAPWTFDAKAQVTFGGVIYRSSILGFIENRSYVDFVTDFVMQLAGIPQQEIQASAERVVFTNGLHTIHLLERNETPAMARRGIGIDWRLT